MDVSDDDDDDEDVIDDDVVCSWEHDEGFDENHSLQAHLDQRTLEKYTYMHIILIYIALNFYMYCDLDQ